MRSPLAIDREAVHQKALLGLDHTPSHDHGVDALAQRIALHIESLVPQGRAECLEIGCGDMALAEGIRERLPRTTWRCLDVQPAPRAPSSDSRWNNYCWFDGRTIPHATGEFDVAVLCDLLHHAPENAARLLAEASRVAEHVLIKDHFEHGRPARTMLRIKDLVGKAGKGIRIRGHSLTREAFVRLVGEQGLVLTALDCGLSRHERTPVVSKMQKPDFIAVLSRV